MKLLDGKKLSKKTYKTIKKKVKSLNVEPRLDIILVGNDYSSKLYVKMKKRKAEELGIKVKVHQFAADISEAKLLKLIDSLNQNHETNGIMVQLPLPQHINKTSIINSINYQKDVDGLTATNLGLIFHNDPYLIPATPQGIIKLLDYYDISVESKKVCIIGTSPHIGIPLAGILNQRFATLFLCHEKTKNIKSYSKQADIVITATGQPQLIKKDWIQKGAIVIDVGIEKDPKTGKLVGDVDFESVAPKTDYITPVPGGVGPMTVASLMANVIKSTAKK